MGPMGIAVNSVAIFNQMAAPGDDILEELNTFDQYEGHPALVVFIIIILNPFGLQTLVKMLLLDFY